MATGTMDPGGSQMQGPGLGLESGSERGGGAAHRGCPVPGAFSSSLCIAVPREQERPTPGLISNLPPAPSCKFMAMKTALAHGVVSCCCHPGPRSYMTWSCCTGGCSTHLRVYHRLHSSASSFPEARGLGLSGTHSRGGLAP